ncbi:hypothetical protein AVEN_265079-1 [Araneus ventricosus]|uniref:Uncharacterized protein n=1 Tax=Araneus ventricosus TaxID=182803 RepID=A0A4Y2TBM9_ARAVE|nr:hypothetical protein AVEN_265079-1 [Araneus ventricosus]
MDGDKMETEEPSKGVGSDKMETEGPSKGVGSDKMETEVPMDEPYNKKIDEGKYDWHETIEPHVRIAVIGESGCGKSSLILAAKNQIFPHPAEKFFSKRYPLDVEVDGKTETCMVAEINVWVGDVDRLKKLYSETDVVLLCFNENHSLKEEWKPENEVPIVAVRIVKKPDRDQLCRELTEMEGIFPILECCPHAREGVQEVFREAVKKAKEREIGEEK